MLKYLLLLSLLLPVSWGADPQSPACLSGPVTLGPITLSCSAIDNTAYGTGTDAANHDYLFQVRVADSDQDVAAVKVTLSWQTTSSVDQAQPIPGSRSATIGKTESVFLYTFTVPRVIDFGGQKQMALSITSVQVQELRAGSSQTF